MGEDLLSWRRGRSVLAARLLLGAVFVFSGAVKVLDTRWFLASLRTYPLPEWLIPFGLLVPPIEVVVGAALLLVIAPRLVARAAMAILVIFSVLIVSGIMSGGLGTCGCFGRLLESSPGWALVRNGVLLLFAAIVVSHHREAEKHWRGWKVSLLGGLLLVCGILTGTTLHDPWIDRSLARVGEPFPSEDWLEKGPVLEGKQLVFVYTVSCHACWNGVANINALASEGGFDIFGVTASSSQEIEWFQRHFEPQFPTHTYDPVRFGEVFRFWPSLYYLEDGVIIGKVEGDIPSFKTLTDVHLLDWIGSPPLESSQRDTTP